MQTPSDLDQRDYANTALEVSAVQAQLIAVLREGGCTLPRSAICYKLLWICDLQDLVPAEFHHQVCNLWSQFWSKLWHLKDLCGKTTLGHGPWEAKSADYFRHSNHFACAKCGFVQVLPAPSV
jgi:hypothetical protein